MPIGPLTPALRYLARLGNTMEAAGLSDTQLLNRFVHRGDETAFAALVRRHGPMVFAVCRRLLRDVNDVEDAFQATFLLLLRKAACLRRPELLGPWLHGVAYRIALKARTLAGKRHKRERPMVEVPALDADDYLWRDLRPILDEAIGQLPPKYRAPFVLCHLEGMTNAQAAHRLGCPPGTIATRLSRARARLRVRLARQGVALSAAALGVALEKSAEAAGAPLSMVQSAVRMVSESGTCTATGAGAISSHVAALTEGVGKAMFMEKVKVIGLATALAIGTVGAGTGMLVLQAQAKQPQAAQAGPIPGNQARPQPGEASAASVPRSGSPTTPESDPNVDRGVEVIVRPGSALPKGSAPCTALAVLDGEGRIVLRMPSRDFYYEPRTTWQPRPDGTATAVTSYAAVGGEHVWLIDMKHVHGYGIDGKRIEVKSIAERLKREIPVLVSMDGKPVDPFYLQLIKEGALVLVLYERDGKQLKPAPAAPLVPQPASSIPLRPVDPPPQPVTPTFPLQPGLNAHPVPATEPPPRLPSP